MMSVQTKLSKEHYDPKSKLETFLDYFDCPVCFVMSENI